MAISRRRLIQAAGGAAAAHVVVPAMARVGEAFGATQPDPASANRNRLVVIHLFGGNDGLNTVIPTSGRNYDVYRKVRPAVSYTPSQTLPIDQHLGLNPKLKTVHSLYKQGRVAVVQGVDYPDHSYSHFTSADIWHSGEPDRAPASGWLGRHLDRVGVHEGELRGVGVGYELPLMLRGTKVSGVEIASISATRFADGSGAVADARHDALALFDHHAANEPLRRFVGNGGRQAVDLVDALAKVPAAKTTGNSLGDAMLTARSLLGLNLGVECVFLGVGGFDTHTGQRAQHEQRLEVVDKAIEAFFLGTYGGKKLGVGALSPALAARTIVLVMSEFGRRVGENGTGAGAGTDHGAAAPVLMLGPRNGRLVAGVHGEHPSLGTTAAPADNLVMTTDVRRLYQSVLTSWLHDPDPLYGRTPTLPGLFR